MITEETVAHVARLARLELSDEEKHRMTQDMTRILHLVDQLSELDLPEQSGETLPEHATQFREDDLVLQWDRDKLMANAPQEEEGFFRVPKILDEDV